jgi:hypothetical protein
VLVEGKPSSGFVKPGAEIAEDLLCGFRERD